MASKYPNNEDIILTAKRIAPKQQRMKDPEDAKALYHYKDGNWVKKGSKRVNILAVLNDDYKDNNEYMNKLEQKKFMEEYLNTCDRCGADISKNKALKPKLYHIGLCQRCNDMMDNDFKLARSYRR